MVLMNNQYTVSISVEARPPLEGYTVVYMPDDLDLSGYYSARLIRIESRGERPRFLALLELITSYARPCAVLENNILTVIQSHKILRINLRTGLVDQCVDCENMGGLEQIYPIENGYIIKSEGDVIRYDSELNRVWHFCGRDIIALPTGEKAIWIEEGYIHCRDWAGWHYILNMEGHLISEEQEKSPPS